MDVRRLVIFAAVLCAGGVARGAEFMAGADISSLPVFEGNNAVYRDNGVAGGVIPMFRQHGVNWYRLRLFVDPQGKNNYDGGPDPFVVQNLAYTIALAQRIKLVGGKVLLDFHYSDTWADPGHQWKPAAWRSLDAAQLQQRVYEYTRDSIASFKNAGVVPEMVQIGNEIAGGLLWNGEYVPANMVNNTTVGGANTGYPWTGGSNSTGFDRLASLLSAGINGARDGAGPGQAPKIMIHHDKGANWGTSSYYFNGVLPRLAANGTPADVLGFSYYPLHHYTPPLGGNPDDGDIADLRTTLNNAANTYGKPVVLVETGFTSRNESGKTYEFSENAAGQRQFLDAVVDAVRDVPNNRGLGVFWWYAEAYDHNSLDVWQDGRYGLFDQDGDLLPAIDAFAGLNPPPPPGDYNVDGRVDAGDLAAWKSAFGQTGVALAADGTGDGRVDGDDFLFWQRQPVTPAIAPVPEPAAGALAAAALAIFALGRRRFPAFC